jgi:hypothetical protein
MVLGSIGEPTVTARWKTLAARKIAELDQTIATARAIKGLLEEGLQCGCVDASECLLKLRKRSPGEAGRRGKPPKHGAAPAAVRAEIARDARRVSVRAV